MIHFIHPFALDKDLGKAYNDAVSLLPKTDHVCLMDYDAMFLHHEQIPRLYEYVKKYPDALLTAIPSRAHEDCRQRDDPNTNYTGLNMGTHVTRAELYLSDSGLFTKQINGVISGFLMLFPVSWDIRFPEGVGCLGVDNEFSRRVMKAGKKILLMESIYIWHTYRLGKDVKDTTHLR